MDIFAKVPGAYFSWSSAPSGWKWKIREILFCKNFNYKNFPRAGCEFGFFLRVQMVTYSLPRQPAAGGKKFGVFLRPHTYFRDSPPQAGKNLDFFWGFKWSLPRQPAAGGKKFGFFLRPHTSSYRPSSPTIAPSAPYIFFAIAIYVTLFSRYSAFGAI